MKYRGIVFLLSLMLCGVLFAHGKIDEAQKNAALDMMVHKRAAQSFNDEEIPESIITAILDSGLSAPSSGNRQPWYFTAISDKNLIKQIGKDVPVKNPKQVQFSDATLAIVVSYIPAQPKDAFASGIATQNMAIAAFTLGYDSRYMTDGAAVINANKKLKTLLNIPENMDALAVLLIGRPSAGYTTDADSGATQRQSRTEKTTIINGK